MRDKSLMKSVFAIAFVALAFAACGDDDNGGTPDAAHVIIPDAAPTPADAAVGGCALQGTVAAPTAQGAFLVTSQTPNFYAWQGVTGMAGTGANFFNFNVTTPMVGTALNLADQDCSAAGAYCFYVLGRYTSSGNMVSGDTYLPSAGSITVTEAGAAVGDTFTFTTSGISLVHVDMNGPAADGCTATFADSTLTGMLRAGKHGEIMHVITSITPLHK
jgi:hypothetical protein